VDQRLVRILGSFITRSTDYALARLEFSMKFPDSLTPPVIDRLPDASEATLRERWEGIEAQLHAAVDYVKLIGRAERTIERSDPTFAWLQRTVRELDQYARALRWVLTVTEADASEGAP
jgi:hypothetical protein